MNSTGLPEPDLLAALQTLLSRIEFVSEDNIAIGTWVEAHRLCREIDANDTPYVALALHLEGRFWTEDAILKSGLRTRGFARFFDP